VKFFFLFFFSPFMLLPFCLCIVLCWLLDFTTERIHQLWPKRKNWESRRLRWIFFLWGMWAVVLCCANVSCCTLLWVSFIFLTD
jgi:hypothetical protein